MEINKDAFEKLCKKHKVDKVKKDCMWRICGAFYRIALEVKGDTKIALCIALTSIDTLFEAMESTG